VKNLVCRRCGVVCKHVVVVTVSCGSTVSCSCVVVAFVMPVFGSYGVPNSGILNYFCWLYEVAFA
jgi:hypothetical protein